MPDVPLGTTSYVNYRVQLVDASGVPLTGKHATDFPGIYYSGDINSATQITLSDLTEWGEDYLQGGILEDVGNGGFYRLDLPDAVFAALGNVTLWGEASGKSVLCPIITITHGFDDNDRAKLFEVIQTGNFDLFTNYKPGPLNLQGAWLSISENLSLTVAASGQITGSSAAAALQNTGLVASGDFNQDFAMEADFFLHASQALNEDIFIGIGDFNDDVSEPFGVDISSGTAVGAGRGNIGINNYGVDCSTGSIAMARNASHTVRVTISVANNSAVIYLDGTQVASSSSTISDLSGVVKLGFLGITAPASSLYVSAVRFLYTANFVPGAAAILAAVEAGSGGSGGGGGGGGGQAGPGADSCTLNIQNASAANIADAGVWISSDAAGQTVVAGTLQTDSDGNVTFLLDAGVTYYLWMQKDGENPINGRAFVAEADV